MTSEAWKAVRGCGERSTSIMELFAADRGRLKRFSRRLDDLLLDFSKTSIDDQALGSLLDLARAAGVEARRDSMFVGDPINGTEGRAVLHVALRARPDRPILVDGEDVLPEVVAVRERCLAFAEAVRGGTVPAADGQPFTDVVNIGIGGSDLGPAMAVQALAPYHDGPRTHFVSNVDGAHLADTLRGLDPARTLFIVASKTFTTVETMTNARSARAWIERSLGEAQAGLHFAAVSTALDKAQAFGIAVERVFSFRDWVGGRYSLWSAVGLPVAIAFGRDRYLEMLEGARTLDEHFLAAPLEANLPVLLGLVGVWHRNARGYSARAVIPYDQRLSRLPAYLQQLDMESNGKGVRLDGGAVESATSPVVFGEPGTNGQHAFFQLLHQGTSVVPVEFLAAAEGHEPGMREHHEILLANCLAQAEALMRGRTLAEARAQLEAQGLPADETDRLAPHRVFPGDRPSVTMLYRRLDPYTLGRLIALYEHRVFVEAAVWDINAFDQWGVELGKELATSLVSLVQGRSEAASHDASTLGLVRHARDLAGL